MDTNTTNTINERFLQSNLQKCDIDHWLIINGWRYQGQGCPVCSIYKNKYFDGTSNSVWKVSVAPVKKVARLTKNNRTMAQNITLEELILKLKEYGKY